MLAKEMRNRGSDGWTEDKRVVDGTACVSNPPMTEKRRRYEMRETAQTETILVGETSSGEEG